LVGSVLLICFLIVFCVVFCYFVLFIFVLFLVRPMLQVSLDCAFLIVPLVFSNVLFVMATISHHAASVNCLLTVFTFHTNIICCDTILYISHTCLNIQLLRQCIMIDTRNLRPTIPRSPQIIWLELELGNSYCLAYLQFLCCKCIFSDYTN
jgi:hypothetical protein